MVPGDFLRFSAPLPETLFLLSRDGIILAANPAALAMLDLRREDVAARPITELVAEPSPRVEAYLQVCCRSTAPTVGVLTWCVTGREPMRLPVYGARVDGPEGCSILLRVPRAEISAGRFLALREKVEALAREIAERRQTEEELGRSRLRLQSVLDNSAACIYLKGADGRYILVNRRYEEITGIRTDEAAGSTDEHLFPAEIARRFRANDLAVLEHGFPMEFEEVLPQPDGDHTFLSLKFPVPDPVTGRAGVGGISTDITGRKRLEQQLRETQKLESLGVLAGGVAHDFNNLLTGILGNASLAEEVLPAGHPAHSAIREVIEASERAAHLTRQMLAYAGKGRFVVERLDLSAAVREIANLVRSSIPRNVMLRLELTPELPPIEADAGQIQQLVMNLVINGAEAIEEGSAGTVLVATGVRQAGPGVADGNYVFLEVRDTGCGMDETTRARIFEPFFTTKFTGRGLGLSAVQGIVRGHNGELRVESAPGSGTTFQVFFPATAGQYDGIALQNVEDGLRGEGLVLVVDDEDVVRRTARLMLERYGYAVLTAENGRDALELFSRRADEIRLVLLDLTMPEMGGEEAFRALRLIRPGALVLLSSGYNEAEAVRRFTNEAVAGFIQKPYTAARLAEKVRQILTGG